MDFRKLGQRVKNILIRPRIEWPRIAAEPTTVPDLYKGYILILAAIPALCLLIRSGIGWLGPAFSSALISYLLSLAMVFVAALIIDALAPSFGAQKNRVQALKTAAYAFTASWIAGIGVLVPGLSTLLSLAGAVYAIYLLYLGLPETMKAPAARAGGYTASVVVAIIAIGVLIGLVATGLFGGTMWLTGRADTPRAERAADGEFDKLLGAIASSRKTEPLDAARLEAFAPAELAGLPRESLDSEREGALGFQISKASAKYVGDGGRELSLEIVDTGGARGFMAFADWADFEEERRDSSGYEATTEENGRIVHKEWSESRRHGEYAVVLGQRFIVGLSGKAVRMEDLEAAAQSIDLAGLEALREEGVRKN